MKYWIYFTIQLVPQPILEWVKNSSWETSPPSDPHVSLNRYISNSIKCHLNFQTADRPRSARETDRWSGVRHHVAVLWHLAERLGRQDISGILFTGRLLACAVYFWSGHVSQVRAENIPPDDCREHVLAADDCRFLLTSKINWWCTTRVSKMSFVRRFCP